tara:strand:+ start:104 stop:205 length:102 start_codon:yes stop_codon:yes gene_type:complete
MLILEEKFGQELHFFFLLTAQDDKKKNKIINKR